MAKDNRENNKVPSLYPWLDELKKKYDRRYIQRKRKPKTATPRTQYPSARELYKQSLQVTLDEGVDAYTHTIISNKISSL